MANFYDLNEPQIVKVKPFFTHLPLITQQQRSDSSISERKIFMRHLMSENSHSPPFTNCKSTQRRKQLQSQSINPKIIHLYGETDEEMQDLSKRRKLSLVSRLVLMRFESNQYLPQHQRALLNRIEIRNGKEAFVEKQMKRKVDELNRTTDMMNKIQIKPQKSNRK